ncbi:MAG: tryptophan 2,3-dioxygenase [Ferruginibacter sp.]|nr:tryptophan 2,3-dioxygenase [Ferruginibacter sp.]
MQQQSVYYSEYLQLNKIIEAQQLESEKDGNTPAHDEMLFIVIHQAYELWFKQILFEIDSVLEIMKKPSINDNSSDLQLIVHRLERVVTIFRILVQQIDILETMTPLDFLDFRDMLRPASGFQSTQFKIIEAKLGLKFDQRHGQDYYLSQLKNNDINKIKQSEEGPSLLELVNKWLERMPFLDDADYWKNYTTHTELKNVHPFWADYAYKYDQSLSESEKNNSVYFKNIFLEEDVSAERSLSSAACRSALFIKLYRGYPLLELPFQMLNTLIEIDNQMGNWRYRHINMVKRMIGSRVGTGGSTGAGYLQGAMDKHYIFREISQLNSFLIDRKKLPVLPMALSEKLGYHF